MTARRALCFLLITALGILASAPAAAMEFTRRNENYLTMRHDITAASEADCVREAAVRTLKRAAGRLYFNSYMYRARHLLDAYLQKNWEDLVARYFVAVSEVRGGQRFCSVEVVVDNHVFLDNMQRMRFLYEPALRPVYYIWLAETYDGRPAPLTARQRLLEMMNERQYRYLWQGEADNPNIAFADREEVRIEEPSFRSDVSADEQSMSAAMRAAQRREVEVFLTGSAVTRTTRKERVYFEDYTFVETQLTLQLVRSDTGEVLASGATTTAAGHVDADQAVKTATLAAINQVAPKIFDTFDATWDKMILDEADYEILALGITPESLDLMREVLAGFSPDAEVFTRAEYGDTAVLTLSWPGSVDDLARILRRMRYPALQLQVRGPRGVVLHLV